MKYYKFSNNIIDNTGSHIILYILAMIDCIRILQ